MQRTLLTLVLGGLASVAVAAPPAVDVNVTNPVLPVEVSNADPIPVTIGSTSEAINAAESGQVTASTYFNQEDIFVNSGDRPVLFTSLNLIVRAGRPCSSVSTPPVVSSFFVANTPGGLVGGPNTAINTTQFSAGRAIISGRCAYTAEHHGSLAVGPGQVLRALVELENFATESVSYQMSASGYRLP